jgi:hypothetical protein
MDFDEDRIYYSHQNLQQQERPSTNGVVDTAVDGDEDDNVDLGAARRHFREFLRKYRSLDRHNMYIAKRCSGYFCSHVVRWEWCNKNHANEILIASIIFLLSRSRQN